MQVSEGKNTVQGLGMSPQQTFTFITNFVFFSFKKAPKTE